MNAYVKGNDVGRKVVTDGIIKKTGTVAFIKPTNPQILPKRQSSVAGLNVAVNKCC